ITRLAGRRGGRGAAAAVTVRVALELTALRRRRVRAVVELPVRLIERAGGAELLPALLVEAAADLGLRGGAALGVHLDPVAVVVPAVDRGRRDLADLVPGRPGEDRVLEGLHRQVGELRLGERVPDRGRLRTTETAAAERDEALLGVRRIRGEHA